MNAYAVELEAISKVFSGAGAESDVVAVDQVSLSIRKGEFFTLLGPSGCGKSTTLRLLAGFVEPSAGEIRIQGRRMNQVPPNRRPVNMVFQNYALFPHLNVEQNIEFGLAVKRVPKSERQARIAEALHWVQLDGFEHRRPNQLSGGQQQRVALARALVNRPDVLLLDEPLGALDLKLRRSMQLELKHLQQHVGITFVYVTHDQEEALTMSDRIAVMNQGRVLQVDVPKDLYEQPRTRFVADFIGETNLLHMKVDALEGENVKLALNGFRVAAKHPLEALHTGQSVSLAIRPEKMALHPRSTRNETDLAGTVEEVVFIGTDYRYVIRLDHGESLVVRVQNTSQAGEEKVAAGGRVAIEWPLEAAQVLVD